MKVINKITNLFELPDERVVKRLKKYIFLSDGELNLEVGKEYTVYGIIFRDNSPWYYLCAEKNDEYPTPYAADFFEITDNKLSSYWKLSIDDRNPEEVLSSLVFSEWAQENPSFYERLLDKHPESIELFVKYRKLMEQESGLESGV